MKPPFTSAAVGTNRRAFLQRASRLGAVSIVAPHILALRGATPPSDRLNLAFIGTAGRGGDNLGGLGTENVVALCDVDTARCAQAAQKFPKARSFQDYRKALDAVGNEIDGVVVSTPDHTHGSIVLAALDLKKHVYCEKPMGHSIQEVRRMMQSAQRQRVVTQLGNQGHSFPSIREFVEMVQSGAIGTVREIHARCQSDYRPRQHRVRPTETPPVPPNLDWNTWLGPAPVRPYHPVYHPGKWRGWVDFGTGVLGDWTCHVIDPVFWALDLGAPQRVTAEADEYQDPRVRSETYPPGCKIRYEFSARGNRPAVTLTWFDGKRTPPRPAELEPGKDIPGIGAIVIGDQGKIIYGSHGAAAARLIPETRWRAYQKPAQTIPRSPGHHEEWAMACKRAGRAGSDFSYGGPLTEIALLGLIALRFPGQTLEWDGPAMRITNHAEANAWVKPDRRSGWEI